MILFAKAQIIGGIVPNLIAFSLFLGAIGYFASTGKMAEHFALWRAKFGVEWDVKPVFNDEEVIKRNKQVAEEIAAMG